MLDEGTRGVAHLKAWLAPEGACAIDIGHNEVNLGADTALAGKAS
jgi:hypothetical protein